MSDLGNKDIMSTNIKKQLKKNNKTRNDLCKALNLKYSTVSDWINGKKYPRIDKIEMMANYFGIPKSELIEKAVSPRPVPYQIPLYSSISCGLGMFIDDCVEDYIAVPDRYIHKGHEYFANTACGDSMIGAGIHDGDVLVFERTPTVENGEIGVFCIDNNDAVCKTFRRLSNGLIMLESSNPKYDPIMIDCTNECFRTIGKLIGSFRKF